MTVSKIQCRIQNAKDLDFGTIFNQPIELFKKVWVQGLVTVGLIFISGLLVAIVGIVGFLICGIGIYITASFSYLPPYFIYKEVIGFGNEIKQIEESVIF